MSEAAVGITPWEYHQRTWHHLDRYAAGPQTLDWDAQPDPFRRYDGCPEIPLVDSIFDFVFEGFDFMSLFTLSALDSSEKKLLKARGKVKEVDEMVTGQLDKAETAVKSYVRQARLSCA